MIWLGSGDDASYLDGCGFRMHWDDKPQDDRRARLQGPQTEGTLRSAIDLSDEQIATALAALVAEPVARRNPA